MNKIHVTTLRRLRRAVYKVRGELRLHGFWDERMAEVEVYLGAIGGAYGWQNRGGDGSIVVPAVSLSKIGDFFRRKYTSLADVVRHEYGHALADTHRGLFRRRSFKTAFWASIDDDTVVAFDPEIHVTPYAAKNAAEDFCETFMMFLKYGGKMPNRFYTPVIRGKWEWVRRLGDTIERR